MVQLYRQIQKKNLEIWTVQWLWKTNTKKRTKEKSCKMQIQIQNTKFCCRDDECYERVCNQGVCAAGYNTPCKVLYEKTWYFILLWYDMQGGQWVDIWVDPNIDPVAALDMEKLCIELLTRTEILLQISFTLPDAHCLISYDKHWLICIPPMNFLSLRLTTMSATEKLSQKLSQNCSPKIAPKISQADNECSWKIISNNIPKISQKISQADNECLWRK